MASPRPHPRRTFNLLSTPSLVTTDTNSSIGPSLKKGATFHSSTSPSGEHDPILNIPSLPKRSSTSLKQLEECVAVASGDRIAKIIGRVDRSLSGLESFASDSQKTITAAEEPIPSFMVNTPPSIKDEDLMEIDTPHTPKQRANNKHHSSDSGIGSTVSSDSVANMKQTHNKPAASESVAQTGINGTSALAADLAKAQQHILGEYACRQVQKHIILPIMREEKLKNFHPLVSGLPYRIARKEITCLRDLEKVLLWLAPKWSVSKSSFLYFCETSIQCIHATVDHLNDRDQRRPTDRPYTNGYFLDLVEQVRQYAAHLAATRSRMAPEERVHLVGGIARTGRPAELVRTKDGKMISLRTGEEVSAEEYKQGLKRSSEEIEEDLERSMARRRKSAPVEKQVQKCSECSKTFKRPCDLTKHEKTHSRPWKCPEHNCKYNDYGWPTEKERDRHVNDKHSASPSMFKCDFHPCPYESKRESNCKQHMEKAHGWTYVRSKNNGKGVPKAKGPGATPPTPVDSTPGSHIFTAPTPEFGDDASVFGTPASTPFRTESVNGSAVTDMSDNYTAEFDFGGMDDFNWNDGEGMNFGDHTHRQSWDSGMEDPNALPSTFSALPTEDESIFGPNFNWSSMNGDMTSMNLQLATPATSVDQLPLDAFSKPGPLDIHNPSLSPVAQADAMLYSPYSMNSNETHDEGYGGDYSHDMKGADFTLFTSGPANMTGNAGDAMFQDLSAFPASCMDNFMPMDH